MCWNRGVPLYTEVSSFQCVGIEGIQRCSHFSGLDSTIYRDVFTSGDWNRGVLLYTEVFSFRGWKKEFYYIQRCPHFRVLE